MEPEITPAIEYFDLTRSFEWDHTLNPLERLFLDTINQAINAAESLDDVMDFLFNVSRKVCPCDRIGLAFLEEDGQRLISRYVRTNYDPVRLGRGYAEDLQGTSLEPILRDRTVRIINDLDAYLASHPESRSTRMLVEEGVRSSMTCPLTVEGRIVALLFRSSRKPHQYNQRQVYMHLAMAEHLSQAVEKAWRIEQLLAANRAYVEMLGFVSHELKNPLASMVTRAKLLAQGYHGDMTPPQKLEIQRLISKGEYLLELVREYLDLARIEDEKLKVRARQDVDFQKDIIEPCLDIIWIQLEEKGMNLEQQVPLSPYVLECDPELMKIVMVNLLSNAVKYGRDGGDVRLKVNYTGSRLYVSVRNEGPGFPEKEKGNLFRKFSRLQIPELKHIKGTGVGLYTVWRIIHLHGGQIRAESEYGSYADFTFFIPQPLDFAHLNVKSTTAHEDYSDLFFVE